MGGYIVNTVLEKCMNTAENLFFWSLYSHSSLKIQFLTLFAFLFSISVYQFHTLFSITLPFLCKLPILTRDCEPFCASLVLQQHGFL